MLRIASLIQAAERQRRQIWASLPFQIRLAELLFRIAADPKETFGRVVYTIFLQQGVIDMPDIKGRPASEFDLKRAPGHMVPPGYGHDFGAKVYNSMLAKYRDQEKVDNAMSEILGRWWANPPDLEGKTLSNAQGIAMKGVSRWGLSQIRDTKRHKRRDDLVVHLDDDSREDAPKLELSGPDAFDDLEMLLKDKDYWARVKRDLAKIPGGLEYVEGVLETGLQDTELVGDDRPGRERPAAIPYFNEHPTNSNAFGVRKKKEILRVLQKNI